MRFVAGQGAVLRCCVQGSVAEILLAGALWLSCCWPGRRGGEPSGISCWPGSRGEAVADREPLAQRTACRSSEAELHREELTAPRKTIQLHREANKRAQKEKGPEETLISLPSHFYLLPCERATRHATRPNRRSPLAFTADMQYRRSCRRHSPLAFTAGMQCWRSCRRHAALAKLPPACNTGEVAAAIMQGLQGRLQQMQELRRALGIRQG